LACCHPDKISISLEFGCKNVKVKPKSGCPRLVSRLVTPLSSLKDPAKIAEVTTMMTEAGVSQDQYGNVEVVTTIAPDNGTFKRDDAILMKKQE
jgi:hypothetical protein